MNRCHQGPNDSSEMLQSVSVSNRRTHLGRSDNDRILGNVQRIISNICSQRTNLDRSTYTCDRLGIPRDLKVTTVTVKADLLEHLSAANTSLSSK